MKWNQEQLAEISTLQEKRSLSRKGAVQFLRRQLKAQGKAAPVAVSGTPDKSAPENPTAGAPAPAPKRVAKAKNATDKPADSPVATDAPRIAPETMLELRPVAESKAHTATIHGKRAVVCYYARYREETKNGNDSVAIAADVWKQSNALAKAEGLPLYVALQVFVGGKRWAGYLVPREVFMTWKKNECDFTLAKAARAAYHEGGFVGHRFEIAKA
jgi:hypothetical protein